MASKGPKKHPTIRSLSAKMLSTAATSSSESGTDINILETLMRDGWEIKIAEPIKDSVDQLRDAVEKIAVRVGEAEARVSELGSTTAAQSIAISVAEV